MPFLRIALLLCIVLLTSACSTKAWFKLPEQSTIAINERPQQYHQGLIKVRPFFWNRAGGVPYTLTSATGSTERGRLRARFRPASIFWPPFALIYWPMGFGQRCYDMTGATPSLCSPDDLTALKKAYRAAR